MKRWKTELGEFDVEVGRDGISLVRLPASAEAEPVDAGLKKSLDAHIDGEPASLKLDLQGLSPLAQVTLAKLLEIPRGEVRPYAWVAREIGRPAAIRPVATIVARNPIPLLIPCHRVVRSDGHIGEYSMGGTDVKRRWLEFEGVDVDYLESLARRGVRFIADLADESFHLPSCTRAPKEVGETRVELHSGEASPLRLRPCPRCRPAPEDD